MPNCSSLPSPDWGSKFNSIDTQLASLSAKLDALLIMTPTNNAGAYKEFMAGKNLSEPKFIYRDIPLDLNQIEEILNRLQVPEDGDSFFEVSYKQKIIELKNVIRMLMARGSREAFLYSEMIYGKVNSEIHSSAESILEKFPHRIPEVEEKTSTPEEFIQAANSTIERYRKINSDFKVNLELRDDLGAMLMVSKNWLYVGRQNRIPTSRIRPLIAHEVETHLLTYVNGGAFPLKIFQHGLAGYEDLQEGLAVLAEYFVGGLTPGRLRLLALRVIACEALKQGFNFVDLFHIFTQEYKFTELTAFTVISRVFRGGGMVKDSIYLRGLNRLLACIHKDSRFIEKCFFGKVGFEHVETMESLLKSMGLAKQKTLIPLYLKDAPAQTLLQSIHDSKLSPLGLVANVDI